MFWNRDTQLDANDARIRAPLDAIERATQRIQRKIGTSATDEDDISPRLAEAIEQEIESLPQAEGTRWSVQVLSPTRKSEARHGSDLAVFAEIDLGDDGRGGPYRRKKTLLIQVKRMDRLSGEMPKLRKQAQDMRGVVGDHASAVLIVDRDRMVAADSAEVNDRTTASEMLNGERTPRDLFQALFCCQAGTEQWQSHAEVARKLNAMRATTVLAIEGRQEYRRR